MKIFGDAFTAAVCKQAIVGKVPSQGLLRTPAKSPMEKVASHDGPGLCRNYDAAR